MEKCEKPQGMIDFFRKESKVIEDSALYYTEKALGRERRRLTGIINGEIEERDPEDILNIRGSIRGEVQKVEQLMVQQSQLLAKSYKKWTGESLVGGSENVSPEAFAGRLFHSMGVLLFHNREKDPRFIYGNAMALDLLGKGWIELMQTYSKTTALPADREERQHALQVVEEEGVVRGYSGLRVTKDKRLFTLHDATLWKVEDDEGVNHGLAAWFTDYSFHV